MAIERVVPISENGIELYVSGKGDKTGMSQRGLARLCGINESSLRELLGDRGRLAKISGETIPTEDLYCAVSSSQQAKVIDSKYCGQIIYYYALESPNKNAIAAHSLKQFAKIGIDKWIKESVGFIETNGIADQRVYDLLAVMVSDIKEMKADLASTSGYRAARIEIPGLRLWMESLTEDDKNQLALPSGEEEPLYTLTEWADIDQDGFILSKNQKHALANLVSATYKAMALEMPPKVSRKNAKGYKLAAVQGYPAKHFNLIRMCFTKLILK
jgi:hypothetical protein